MQHLPLQPRVGSAGCTCCTRKLCAAKDTCLAHWHVHIPGQHSTLPRKSVITSDMSERSVSTHAECLQITATSPIHGPIAYDYEFGFLRSLELAPWPLPCQLAAASQELSKAAIHWRRQRSGGLHGFINWD